MKNRLISIASLVLLTFSFSANAIVKRYTLKQEFPKGTIEKDHNTYLQVEVDLWVGENETVLIAAGYSLSTFGTDVSQLWGKRKMLSADVVHFSADKNSIFVEINDTHNSENGILISIEKGEEGREKMVAVPGEHSVAAHGYVVPQKIYEIDYKPSHLTRTNIAVEVFNRPVGFAEFFANKQTMFNGQLNTVRPPPPAEQLRLDFNGFPKKKLSKKQQKKELARLKKLHGAKHWIGSQPGKTSSAPSQRSFGYDSYDYDSYESYGSYKFKEVRLKGFEKQIDALVSMDAKPRIGDVIALMKEIRESQPDYDLNENPFRDYIWRGESGVRSATAKIPALVEKLETAFPGAIWYLLGRDVYLLNDAMEAYYLTLGQTGRVVRLPASAPSFRNANLSLVDGFLKSNDLNVDEIAADSTPRIILDISSYNAGTYRLSQSRHLMRAAYDRWSNKLGRNPKDLVNKVNFVNVSSTHGHLRYQSEEEAAKFLADVEFDPEPKHILTAIAPDEFLYTDAWHGLYDEFKEKGGQVVAGHSGPSSREQKLALLGEVWAILAHFGLDNLTGSCEQALKGKK